MQGLLRLASGIDRITKAFGILAALLVAVACMISALNAVSRYALDVSSNAFLEIQWQMFAAIFLLGAAHVLRLNEHVRVDLIYGSVSSRGKLWIDVVGFVVFFFPLCFIMLSMGIPWAYHSFVAGEISANAGGAAGLAGQGAAAARVRAAADPGDRRTHPADRGPAGCHRA